MADSLLESVLVVVGRAPESQVGLRKAVVLARHFSATLELLLCEPDPVTDAMQAGAQRVLAALRGSIAAGDVQVETSWVGGASLSDGIARRVAARRPGIVLRSVAGPAELGRLPIGLADRELLRSCEAPLLLTRRASWAPRPRFAVGTPEHWVDPATEPGSGRDWACEFARALAGGCHGEVAEVAMTSGIDALLVPQPGPEQGIGSSVAEILLDEDECDLIVMPALRPPALPAAEFTRRRGVRAVSS